MHIFTPSMLNWCSSPSSKQDSAVQFSSLSTGRGVRISPHAMHGAAASHQPSLSVGKPAGHERDLASRSITFGHSHTASPPPQPPPAPPGRRTIGQVVKALGARLEAFVSRPFATDSRSSGRRVSSLVPPTNDRGRREEGHLPLPYGNILAAPSRSAGHRASTGCILPIPEADGGTTFSSAVSVTSPSTATATRGRAGTSAAGGDPPGSISPYSSGGGYRSGGGFLPTIFPGRASVGAEGSSRMYRASEPEFNILTTLRTGSMRSNSGLAAPVVAGGRSPDQEKGSWVGGTSGDYTGGAGFA